MQNYCKSLVLIVIVLFFNDCAVASSEMLPPSPILNVSKFDLDDIPISWYRVFKVPGDNFLVAEKIVDENKYHLLSATELKKLFPNYLFDLSSALSHEVSDADVYAKESEVISAKNPDSKSSIRVAQTYRDYANYTKTLRPPLYPYLVKAKVYAEGTGAFSISLKKNTLDVYHGSLSQRDLPEHYVYIVVFVERKIDSVVVNAGYSS